MTSKNNPKPFNSSTSVAGEATKVYLAFDHTNPKHVAQLQAFYQALKEPIGKRQIGRINCPNHGKTIFLQVAGQTECYHSLAKRICPDMYLDTLHDTTTLS